MIWNVIYAMFGTIVTAWTFLVRCLIKKMFIGSVRPVVPKIPLGLCSSRECASGTCTCMSVGGRVVEPVLYCMHVALRPVYQWAHG